jgi:hypothetical protein
MEPPICGNINSGQYYNQGFNKAIILELEGYYIGDTG